MPYVHRPSLPPAHVGVSLFAYFIGSMSRVIATVDSRQATISRKRAAVDEFLHLRKLPQ